MHVDRYIIKSNFAGSFYCVYDRLTNQLIARQSDLGSAKAIAAELESVWIYRKEVIRKRDQVFAI
jgi:hypothetical protein